ncbi:uncharacterized protein LOC110055511 [Orbicella faveolata]|uniref:uncharacterized protein LOC110055511 n=1 Tax=Orbicella faveolata TaxID=48498 RepID=UPI0009E45230|nr:uncharacterized protein LOC110055511 [Orbicella faveolata]
MAAGKRYFVISLLIFFLVSVCCLPEPGKKDLHFKENQTFGIFAKTMNKNYSVAIKGSCNGTVKKINIYWRLYVSQCAERFSSLKDSDQDYLQYLWKDPPKEFSAYSLTGKQDEVNCKPRIHLSVCMCYFFIFLN